MIFLVNMKVNFPESISSTEVADLQRREKQYSQNLQKQGVMKAIWRTVGQYANYSVFEATDNDHLHSTIEKFPMFHLMAISVTPLATHPNAMFSDFFRSE